MAMRFAPGSPMPRVPPVLKLSDNAFWISSMPGPLSSGPMVIAELIPACDECTEERFRGDRCLIVVPLHPTDEVFGALMISAPRSMAEESDADKLCGEIDGDLSFALFRIHQQAAHKKAEREREHLMMAVEQAGEGTTIKVYLPRAEAGLEPGRREEDQTKELTGEETVLIVEDDYSIRKMIVRILGRYGYRILDASDGKKALEVCSGFEGKIHLLITDVIMPDMNGKALAERLRAERPDMKVLFMSGYTQNIIMQKGILTTDIHYIQKPFFFEGLAMKVRKALGN